MNKKGYQTRELVEMALLVAIIIVLSQTPLGYIPLGFLNATTIHIPVIIAGIVLGMRQGAICGFIFGFSSVINAIVRPNATSFLFCPLLPYGNIWSLVIAFVPRILIGVVAFIVFKSFMKIIKVKSVSAFIAGVLGSLTNTILVMLMAYVFFATPYANAIGVSKDLVFKSIMTVILVQGVPEALVAGLISSAVGVALLSISKK